VTGGLDRPLRYRRLDDYLTVCTQAE